MKKCAKCGVVLQRHWLKNGVCNGCRNPHLIIKCKRNYAVSIPVCYYEVFHVAAFSKKDALRRIQECDGDVEQNCTDANKKWSRRILYDLLDEHGTIQEKTSRSDKKDGIVAKKEKKHVHTRK